MPARHTLACCLAFTCIISACGSERVLAPMAQFTLSPRNSLLQEGMVLQLKALVATDGPAMEGPVTWSSSDMTVASIDANGLLTARSPGTVMVIATAGTVADSTGVSVQSRERVTLVASGDTNCGLTTTSGAVCWGENSFGQTGTRSVAQVVFVPTPVAASVTWRSLAASWNHACGVDTQADIYCWGLNGSGQLGMGDASDPVIPSRRVAGDRKFVSVSAGGAAWQPASDIEIITAQQTCGLTLEGEAYCWGVQGNPVTSGDTQSNAPRAVAPGMRFASISVGNGYVCAIAIDRRAYCWGNNELGQLGRAQAAFDRGPRLVEGDLRFERISAGGLHACGIAVDGSAYCWGANEALQLGAASSGQCSYRGTVVQCQTRPIAVTGGYRFTSISAGSWGEAPSFFRPPSGYTSHTCGVTVAQDIVCWGWNAQSQVWRREHIIIPQTMPPTLAPFEGVKLRAVATGGTHTCAVSVENRAYCWGNPSRGQQGVPQNETHPNFHKLVAGGFLFK